MGACSVAGGCLRPPGEVTSEQSRMAPPGSLPGTGPDGTDGPAWPEVRRRSCYERPSRSFLRREVSRSNRPGTRIDPGRGRWRSDGRCAVHGFQDEEEPSTVPLEDIPEPVEPGGVERDEAPVAPEGTPAMDHKVFLMER